MKTYIVEPCSVDAAGAQRWLLRCDGAMLATFGTKEAACDAARTLGRIDVLAGGEAEAWLHGCSPSPMRIRLEIVTGNASEATDAT